MKVFGCKTFAHIPDEKRSKLESKSIPYVFLGYCEGTKAYRLMCLETKRIIKSRNVVFFEGTKEVEGVCDKRRLSDQIEHLVVDEVDELVKDVDPISLKARPTKDVEGDDFTTNSSLEEEFASSQDEGLNEPQQDGPRERPQRQRKEWPRDWWVATKEVERATMAFSEEPQTMEEALNGEMQQRSGRLPCKKNMTLFLSITLGPWCHSLRVENPFLANGCSKSNMGSMVKSNGTRRDLWQEVLPKHLELITMKLLHPLQSLCQFVISLH